MQPFSASGYPSFHYEIAAIAERLIGTSNQIVDAAGQFGYAGDD